MYHVIPTDQPHFLGYNDPKTIDARLIVPIFDIICPYLPEQIRKHLRFGIVHKDVSIIYYLYKGFLQLFSS